MWQIRICFSIFLQEVNQPSVQLLLKKRNTDTDSIEKVAFTLSEDKFCVFLNGRYSIPFVTDYLSAAPDKYKSWRLPLNFHATRWQNILLPWSKSLVTFGKSLYFSCLVLWMWHKSVIPCTWVSMPGKDPTHGTIPPQNNGCIVLSVLVHSSNEGNALQSPVGAVGTLELFPSENNCTECPYLNYPGFCPGFSWKYHLAMFLKAF
jgi:hypothetical protein